MNTPAALAYSYLRFSTLEQAAGDSVRRQTDLRDQWLARHPHVTLDTSLSLRDLGKSAFTGEHRKNPDRHALAAFLKLIEASKVPRGSYLIVENLDRLTREDERAALRLWLDILDAGINIVQLTPETIFRHERSEMIDVIRAIIELSRGHGESARKAERNGAAWQNKVAMAREGKAQPPRRKDGRLTRSITGRLPAWVEEHGGALRLVPERAAVVARIFALAGGGYGIASIVKKLTEDRVEPFGRSGVWVRAYVAKILADRRALGEYQPRGAGRKPEGDPIAGYFPAVVDEAAWHAARAGAAERRRRPGRVGEHVNVFAGLLRNARDGDTFFATADRGGSGRRVLINTAGSEGRARYESFPADVFEAAVFSLLREVDPHAILNGDHGPDEALVLSGELERVKASITALTVEMDANGESPTLFRRLREKEAQERQLAERLALAQQKARSPLSASWGETQSLVGALASAPDPTDARLRLRSALRRIVEAAWLLIVPRGRDRLCAVQVWFAGGEKRRDYLVLFRPAKANGRARVEGGWWTRSMADVAAEGGLDLRKPEHARRLEKALESFDLTTLTNA